VRFPVAMERSNHTVTEFILLGFTTDPVMQLVLFIMFVGVYSVTVRFPVAMERSNHTVTEFILLGFTTDPVMQLVLFIMFVGVYSVTVLGNTTLMVFCGKNIIDHFCDAPPLVKMSCTDTQVYEKVILGVVGFTVLSNILAILISYFNILLAILRIHTASGRRKAFSTCVSHLILVMLVYRSLLFMYSRPSSTYSLGKDKVAALFYTVVNPLLNPLICSLRNKDVKEAFWKATQTRSCQR
ncbi:Olfactory receptor 9G4, partial [Camelus dromedarius]